jgi:hypothetical protein
MEPASTIIEKLGGVATVAANLKLNRTSVLRWTHSRAQGGTDGLVPSKHQQRLLTLASETGVGLSPDHFFRTDSQAAA